MSASHRSLASTRNAFLIMGCMEAAWAPLVPYVKHTFALDEAQLGLLLLCSGLGAVTALPLAGRLTMSHGVRRLVRLSGVLIATALVAISTLWSVWLTAVMLLMFGACTIFIDVAANINGVELERQQRKPLMSGFHGGYALGTLMGTGAVSLLFTIGLQPMPTMALVALAALATLTWGCAGLCGKGDIAASEPSDEAPRPWYAVPPTILLIGAMCFIVYAAEGAMMSWSAVFAHDSRGVDLRYAGYFFLAYSLTMTVMRLLGNRVVARFGDRRVVALGALLVAAGFALAVSIAHWLSAVVGFAVIGFGTANIVPRLISLGATVRGIKVQNAISIINALGYSGILLGPVGIGFVAHRWSLSTSFALLAALMALVAVATWRMFAAPSASER